MDARAELQTALMEAFSFDEHDLEQNRAGRYSLSQLARFRRKRAILPVGGVAAVAVALLGGYAAGSDRAKNAAASRERQGLPPLSVPFDWNLGLGVFAAFFGFLMFWVLLLWWRLYWRELRTGPRLTTGPVGVGRAGRYVRLPTITFGSGRHRRYVFIKPEHKELVARIGSAHVYWTFGSANGLRSIDLVDLVGHPSSPKSATESDSEPSVPTLHERVDQQLHARKQTMTRPATIEPEVVSSVPATQAAPREERIPSQESQTADSSTATSKDQLRQLKALLLARQVSLEDAVAPQPQQLDLQLQLADQLVASAWSAGPTRWGDIRNRAALIYLELLDTAETTEMRTRIITSLGGVLSDLGRYSEAVDLLHPAINKPGADRNTVYNLAVALMNTDEEGRRRAKPFFESARNRPPAKQTHTAFFDPHGY